MINGEDYTPKWAAPYWSLGADYYKGGIVGISTRNSDLHIYITISTADTSIKINQTGNYKIGIKKVTASLASSCLYETDSINTGMLTITKFYT